MEQTFTINLVSNASMQVFAENTMAEFTTLLPHRIELAAGDWEVALLEASWPVKVKNITSASFTFSQFDKTTKTPTRPQHNQTIPDGYYPNVDILMTKLLQTVYKRNDQNYPVSWKVDLVSEKIEIYFNSQEIGDQFLLLFKSSDLSNTLGITNTICCTMAEQLEKGYAVQGTYPVDLQGGRHTMFLYCDLIQNEILGDAQTALLRAIPLNQRDAASNATCYRNFHKLQWKKLTKTNFQSITIRLCDKSGHLMPFASIGRTNLTLAFRRRHSSSFNTNQQF